MLPCKKCVDDHVECVYTAHEKKRYNFELASNTKFYRPGHKGDEANAILGARPVSREVVTSLEKMLETYTKQITELQGQNEALRGLVNWWESYVGNLAQADAASREVMLDVFRARGEEAAVVAAADTEDQCPTTIADSPSTQVARCSSGPSSEAGLRTHGRSIFQIAMGVPHPKPQTTGQSLNHNDNDFALLSSQSEDCKRLMSVFFLRLYPYHMHFYREFFLRDLYAGGGPYYSNLLMYAICSIAALVSKDPAERQRSELFAQRAQGLLYDSGMDSPNITVLQALLLLSQREIGQGNGSKGWLFAGKDFSPTITISSSRWD